MNHELPDVQAGFRKGRGTRDQIANIAGSLTEKAMAPHSSTLAWEIPWMEEPHRLQSMGSLRVGHDWSDVAAAAAAAAAAGKTSRPFRYDLNQIRYDYTVEVTNRFKGFDLIDRVPEELWTEVHDIVQEVGINTIPKKNKCKKKKMVFWRGLTNNYDKKRSERQKKKGKIYSHECRVPKNSKVR